MITKYKCPECGWIGVEKDMEADYFTMFDEDGNWDDEVWSNWICPGCHMWHQLEDYEKVEQ